MLAADVLQTRRVRTTFAYLESWLNWLRFKVLGYYLLQALLFVGLLVPCIVPWITRLACLLLFRDTRSRTDRSDRVFNFDCLFKQYVCRPGCRRGR